MADVADMEDMVDVTDKESTTKEDINDQLVFGDVCLVKLVDPVTGEQKVLDAGTNDKEANNEELDKDYDEDFDKDYNQDGKIS